MKIICIGRNYAEHAAELGNPKTESPLFFLKPDSAILTKKHAFYLPDWTDDMHYEVEVVIKINRLGKAIDKKFANRYYSEIGLGIDFTARDVQTELKANGHPWEKAKAFDGSAVVSEKFIPLEELGGDVQNINFDLSLNNSLVQKGNTRDMIFSVDDLIVYLSKYMTIKTGDLIFTGTPAGVGAVESGDLLTGSLEGNPMLSVRIR
jgi:2-keto-4-pentenoate hydratase/2-oxohepta-3-ene-1,7-dioic acid hydratase in catechol pathway